MNKKKILILLIITIMLISSCNTNTTNKNTSSSSDFEENNTIIINNEITAITDQNTLPNEESTDESTKYNIGSATHEDEQFVKETEPETNIIYDDSDNVIYQEQLKWYVNEDIVSLGFAEMYISASAKRTDPKYSQLRDPEIRLIHLIGENGAKEINAAIDKAVTEPYSEYISQIQSNNYTSGNLFVCQSYVITYDHIAFIKISFWTYSGTLATGGRFGESLIFYYDFAEDKVLSVSDVLNTVAINDKIFLEVFNNYAAIINSKESNYTFENIQWLIPGETGITVCIYFNDYDEYPTEFTIPYNDLT